MPTFTVFGANGFLGSSLSSVLEAAGHSVRRVARSSWPEPGSDLGHVIYAIGVTADFRDRPYATAETAVGLLVDVLSRYTYCSFLYLSSTRVYAGALTGREDAEIRVKTTRPAEIYNATKLAGESLCFALDRPSVRVARVSNVIGSAAPSETFLSSVLAEGRRSGSVVIRTGPDSRKDYIDVRDVARIVPRIILEGTKRCYNVASGRSVSNLEVAELLRRELGWAVSFAIDGPTAVFPDVVIQRIIEEFGFVPTPFEQSIADLTVPRVGRVLNDQPPL